ncbi:MAG: penicillin-binding transpeptidase domain-containing protein, partial [Gemmatimonadetes bacterium]|nr:penicillin-binding transpeptidase domain-containing protein [Gemmatimonadota bacterium]
ASYSDTNAAGHPVYKNRLLELYLNEVFYGTNAYGIYDAAITFFDTTPDSLSLPRAAMLIGQVNAPTKYNPLRHPQRATSRLQHVFDRMVASGFLDLETRREYATLQAEDLINPGYPPRNPVPYWVEAINAEIVQQWGPSALHYGSLKVYTTLDIAMQEAAEEVVAKGMVELDERLGFKPYSEASMAERPAYVQGALVCLSPTGKVLAMVGGRDIFVSYYNRALTARRQPGSGFKPIAYLAALEAGEISPVTIFNDEPRTYIDNGKKWQPRNYGGRYLGQTTAAWALVRSANSTAIQISELVGPPRVVEIAHRLGFAGPIGAYKSIALGVAEVTVLEMAAAYGIFANYGLQVTPTLIERIVDADGQQIFTHQPQIRQAIAPDLAAQMVHLLRQTVDRGTGHQVRKRGFARPAAGKTGTTNDNTDAWFTGFTPDLIASVWVGFDERRTHKLVDTRGVQITGGNGAVPIWTDFMIAINEGRPEKDFDAPEDVMIHSVDPRTGEVSSKPNKDGVEPLSVALRRSERPN